MPIRETMPWNHIQKIIEEAVPHCHTCYPFHYQEPMLEPRLISILQKIKETNPSCQTGIYTNMTLMDDEKSKELVECGYLDNIYISFYGPTRELYNKYQPGNRDWLQTQVNILDLMKNRSGKTTPKVHMWYVDIPELMNHYHAMASKWQRIVDIFQSVQYESFNGRKPEVTQYNTFLTRHPCSRLWQGLNILCDGTVVPCCLDCNGEVPLGNAFEENSMDIWNGSKFSEIRIIHQNCQFDRLPDLCKRCTVWRRQ
jgi:MoaA/NifB/PqqE/SkfB family radical SAM enzyme